MKIPLIIKGKRISKVGFFGLGKSNLALFDHLLENYEGLSFTLRSDKPEKADQRFSVVKLGEKAREDITEDVLFFSPSVRRDAPEFLFASARGVIFSSDVEYFFENKRYPIFSVTGSDGKSTTATLASLMLSEEKRKFPASANIGLPICSLFGESDVFGTVAELSSFQLMNFSPNSDRALVTNVSENHLDWHTTMAEYLGAKENILKLSRKRIFNFDCPYSVEFSKKYPAFAVFSTILPFEKLKKTVTANHYFTLDGSSVLQNGLGFLDLSKARLVGKHNLSNILSALALTAELITPEKAERVISDFGGLDHRMKLVGKFCGVSFYDSSVDSTPLRTKTTLASFSEPTILILGGKSKKLSYAPLFPIPKNVKALILTGENQDELEAEISLRRSEMSGIKILKADRFDKAVTMAIKEACDGDSVLLSPAATSFDNFKDYKERGRAFSEIIKNYYADI